MATGLTAWGFWRRHGASRDGQANVVTERRTLQEAMTRSEANFRVLSQHVPFGIMVVAEGTVRYVNPALTTMLGRSVAKGDSIQGLIDQHLHPEDRTRGTPFHSSPDDDARAPVTELLRIQRGNGDAMAVEVSRASITYDDAPASLVSVHDVSERERLQALRREVERSLRESLREKETLLKEIHHRIKNNLQLIASLLNLQSDRVSDPSSRDAFIETRARIFAIARLHEHIYQSQDLDRIDMGPYLRGLIEDLRHAQGRPTAVEIECRADGHYFPMNAAIPVGLIVSELVTNALKHAFPNPTVAPPRIAVELSEAERVGFLRVEDNGVGAPDLGRIEDSGSIGMLIIASLTQQLNGKVSVDGHKGFRVAVEFPVRSAGLTDGRVPAVS
ncbi:MAG: PAS domain S-box protein [Deltaproteobacteria bacterium]|nr:PAS domain S-box protein [Deltaproteobacteria bacterium]